MFCKTCLSALQDPKYQFHPGGKPKDDATYLAFHHSTVAGLRAAAESGCRFCSTFWNQYTFKERLLLLESDKEFLRQDESDENSDSEHAYHTSAKWYDIRNYATYCSFSLEDPREVPDFEALGLEIGLTIILTESHHLPNSGNHTNHAYFELIPIRSAAQTNQNLKKHVARLSSTASMETWQLVERWIHTCVSCHPKCNRLSREIWYPRRLLEFEKDGQSVRLVETSEHSCTGRYITLSYRWASHSTNMLTRTTYEGMRQGIAITSLQQTFQDAITICKRLDIHFLWIDSLCIMQDSDDRSDWIHEAETMQKVYSHSFLNISALAAEDSSNSFFVTRNSDVLSVPRICTSMDPPHPPHHTRNSQEYRVIDTSFWQYELSDAPLNLRGWVRILLGRPFLRLKPILTESNAFRTLILNDTPNISSFSGEEELLTFSSVWQVLQERLLPPRVLHFGAQQVFWECCQTDATEGFPDGLPIQFSQHIHARFKDLDPKSHAARMRNEYDGDPPEMAPYRLWSRVVDTYSKCSLTNSGDKLIAIAGIARYMANLVHDEYVIGMWRRYLELELLWSVAHNDFRLDTQQDSRRPEIYRAPTFSWASIDGELRYGEMQGDPLIKVLKVETQLVWEDPFGLVEDGSLLLACQLQKLSMIDHGPYGYRLHINDIEGLKLNPTEFLERGVELYLDEHIRYFSPTEADQESLYCVPASTRRSGSLQPVTSLLLQVIDAEQGTYRRWGLTIASEASDIEVMRSRSEREHEFPCVSYEDGKHVIRLI